MEMSNRELQSLKKSVLKHISVILHTPVQSWDVQMCSVSL